MGGPSRRHQSQRNALFLPLISHLPMPGNGACRRDWLCCNPFSGKVLEFTSESKGAGRVCRAMFVVSPTRLHARNSETR